MTMVCVTTRKSAVTEEEAVLLWDKIKDFKRQFGVNPSLQSNDAFERRLTEVLAFVRDQKARQMLATHANEPE